MLRMNPASPLQLKSFSGRSSRSLRVHHVVPSAISSTKVYASRAKPLLIGVLSALASRRGRISADIVRVRCVPPCCAVNPFSSRRVHIAGEAGESQRVSVVGPHGPAKPNFCRYRQVKTPCCAVGHFISRRVHVAGKAGSRQRVSVSGPQGPVKPAFCRTPRRDRWMCVTCYAPT